MKKHKKKGNVLSSVCGALWMVAILAELYMIMEYPSNFFGLVGMGLVILGLGIIALSGMGRQDKEWAGGNEGGSQLQEMLNAQKALYVVNKQNEELLKQLLKVQQSQVNEILEGNKNIAKVIVKKNMESTDKLIQSNASFMLNNSPIEVEEPAVINEQLTEKMIEKLAVAWQKTLEEGNANLVSQIENVLNLSGIQQLGERMPEELAQAMNFAMVPFVEGIDTMPQKLAQVLDKDSFIRELKNVFEFNTQGNLQMNSQEQLYQQDNEQMFNDTYEEVITQMSDEPAAATLEEVLHPMEEAVKEQDLDVTQMLQQEVESTGELEGIMSSLDEEVTELPEQEEIAIAEEEVTEESEEIELAEAEVTEEPESIELAEAEVTEEPEEIELAEAEVTEEPEEIELAEAEVTEEPESIELAKAEVTEEPESIELPEAEKTEEPDAIESLEAMEAEITELLGLEGNESTVEVKETEEPEEPDAIESLEAMEAEITELLGLEESVQTEEPETMLVEAKEEPEEEIQIPDISVDANRMLNPDEIAALVAGVSEPEPKLNEEVLVEEEVQDDIQEEEPEEEIQIPDISMDTNRMLNPDEIEALIAGVSEPQSESNEKVEEVELAVTQEDSHQSNVEVEDEEEPVEIHVSEDSNRQLSPEEIAALFASI